MSNISDMSLMKYIKQSIAIGKYQSTDNGC